MYYIYWHVLFYKLKLRTIKSKNTQHRDFPGDPVVKSVLLMQGAWVQFLVLWDFPGRNTGVGCHFLFQGIFLTKG